MKRSRFASTIAFGGLTALAACSSWDTGSSHIDDVERACLETVDTFARASGRCKGDYKTSYDFYLKDFTKGDCKNITAIRDVDALRTKCLPAVEAQPCPSFQSGVVDPSCALQLERSR